MRRMRRMRRRTPWNDSFPASGTLTTAVDHRNLMICDAFGGDVSRKDKT